MKKGTSVFKRKYGFTIKELAEKYNVSTASIFLWDKKGLKFHDEISQEISSEADKEEKSNRNGYVVMVKNLAPRLYKTLKNINFRCNNPKDSKFQYYGGKGIKNSLTLIQLMYLWERDGAEAMKQPSIDRIDSNSNYTLENCRYIEMDVNRIG